MAEKSRNARNISRLRYATIVVKTSAVKPIGIILKGMEI